MKLLLLIAGFFLTSFASQAAIERFPIEEFARQPDVIRARLSPDGKHLAFLRDHEGITKLHALEIDTGQMSRFNLGEIPQLNDARKEAHTFEWVSNRRLLITTSVWDEIWGTMAINLDGTDPAAISGNEGELGQMRGLRTFAREVIHRFYDEEQNVLMLDRHEDYYGSRNRPDVLLVNTRTGKMKTVVKNPGTVRAWGVDSKGVVRFGILSHGELSGAVYRETDKDEWRTILPLQNRLGDMRPIGFDAVNNKIFIAALTPEKRWTVFPLDPENGKMGEPLLADSEYDILPARYIPTMDGMPLASPILSRTRDALLGVRHVTDAPRVKWFSPELVGIQRAIDRAASETVNLLVETSLDRKRMLWFGFSDQHPGTYFLLDADKRSFKPVANRMSWIKREQMAPMLAIKYQARDGLTIHGYLTVPVGHQPKQLPLIVLPHGGPWVRDVWEFDPFVQLLANRGYAVLQMNYRGSPGYGEELYLNARRQIGRKIQDDIEDGARWAISAGVADPQRLAIVGASYGGYSALFALGRNPELYRCGISIAGVSDWMDIFNKRRDDPDYRVANAHWRREIGDPDKDADFLREVSPANFAANITAPVLIIQGKEDRVVPPAQARLMIEALEKAGRPPESLFVAKQGHQWSSAKGRLEIFTRVVEFLEKHLGPGVE